MTATQLTFALIAASISALSFLLGQVLSYWRARRHTETVAAKALSQLAANSMAVTIERLEIRYDQALLRSQGHTLREYRSKTAVAMLGEVKTAELPIAVVEDFLKFRAGVEALNISMNSENPKKSVPLGAYRRVFVPTSQSYARLRNHLCEAAHIDMPEFLWLPPDKHEPLVWEHFSAERAADPDLEAKWN